MPAEVRQKFLSTAMSGEPGDLHDPLDFPTVDRKIMDRAILGLKQRFPLSNDRYILDITDLSYQGNEDISLKKQKEAVLNGESVSRRLKGRWVLKDAKTGAEVSSTGSTTIMNVPVLTERGTFIRNGNEMSLVNMLRLNPGVYHRVKNNGLLESHINPEQGSGFPFKIEMDPDTAVFDIRHGGRKVNFYSTLKESGASDAEIEEALGLDIAAANRQKAEGKVKKTYPGGVSRIKMIKLAQETAGPDLDNDEDEEIDIAGKAETPVDKQPFSELLKTMRLDPGSTEITLGKPYQDVNYKMLLASARKLLSISRGESMPDKRDSMEFQRFYSAPDYISERIVKDGGRIARNLLWKATNKGNLDFMQAGMLNKHVDSVFNESSLSQYIEGSSPVDALDTNAKVTRLGEGGIKSTRGAPEESRMLQNSYKNFIDPARTVDRIKVGLDMYITQGTRAGDNGLLYNKFKNARTGETEYLDSVTASKKIISTPEYMDSSEKTVPAFFPGKSIELVPKESVDYYIPDSNTMFSVGTNTVPFKGGASGLRVNMGSKYPMQAMPLVNREAPLVRNADADGDIETVLGSRMGIRKARTDGVVQYADDDFITVRDASGKTEKYDLYNNFPVNKKGYMHSYLNVKPGQPVRAGDVLAYSNFTDKDGVAALGTNLRTAFISWHGQNYEDAISISESAAKKLTSQNTYRNRLDVDDSTIVDKNKFRALYPGKFTAEQYAKVGEDGLVKPGTQVYPGDPLILGYMENAPSPANMGRRIASNKSKIWDNDYPGTITDVRKGKNYYSVFIRADAPMQVADKMSNRYGSKGVVGTIIPDKDMPHDKDGVPFEVLMSPLSVLTRGNPSQLAETALGKVAAKTGKPILVPGFSNKNMVESALDELHKNGLEDTEDLTDPASGRKIPGVFTGVSYYYKLKHTAESKESARGASEGYTVDETPMLGSEGKCFAPKQRIWTIHGERKISSIVEKKHAEFAWTYDKDREEWCYKPITDWFVRRAKISDLINIGLAGIPCSAGIKNVKYASCMYVTKNHSIYKHDGSVVPAGQLKAGDELITWGPGPTRDQMDMMLGSLLGDSSIDLDGLSCTHSIKQTEYLNFKQQVLAGLLATRYECADAVDKKTGVHSGRAVIVVPGKQIGVPLTALCIKDGRKTVTREWLDKLGELGICIWFLDDGCLTDRKDKTRHEITLCTHSYSLEEVQLLKDWLSERLGTHDMRVSPCYSNKSQYVLFLNKASCEKIVDMVARNIPVHVIPKTKQRLIRLVQDKQTLNPPRKLDTTCKLVKVKAYVSSISPYVHDKPDIEEINVYDFTVADTHSYVAGGVLVSNSKRLGSLEVSALVGHGVKEVLKDAKLIKGQQNDDFWRDFRMGQTPMSPGEPLIHKKFFDTLRASGVNIKNTKNSIDIFGMTNKDVMEMTGGRQVTRPSTYNAKDFRPAPGGLFDPNIFGQDGSQFGYIALDEPVLNPIMENSVRSMLGLTEKKFNSILRGEDELPGRGRGVQAIIAALDSINIPAETEKTLKLVKDSTGSKRDSAVKKLRALVSIDKQGLVPGDFFLTRIPVLPPKYRQVTSVGDSIVSADVNYLYKSLMDSVEDVRSAKDILPDEDVMKAKANVYTKYKDVVGMSRPEDIKLVQKNVGGLLEWVFGKGSAKTGAFHRRITSMAMDTVGRGVITPNPSLKLNEMGIPESQAWDAYEPFITRKLVQRGYPATTAVKMVADRQPEAYKALTEAVHERPIIVNRAPTLHKYGIMAFWPVLTKGKTIQVSPSIVKPYNADMDGDTVNFYVPTTSEASKEAIDRMMPEKNLISPRFMKVQYKPEAEYQQGIYLASKPPSGLARRSFKTRAEAVAAYRKGELRIDEPVTVMEK